MKDNPVFTIIMATYNRGYIIERALKSIVNQTFPDWECIIVDDNSTDNTSEIVSKFTSEDSRFKYIKKPPHIPKGLSASRNIAIKEAKGDFILFADDDDIVHPQLLEIVYELFKRHPDLDFVFYEIKTFHFELHPDFLKPIEKPSHDFFSEPIWEKIVIGKIPMASCSVAWRSELLKNQFFDESLLFGEERELYSRIALGKNIKGIHLKEPLYFAWKHPDSNTGEFAQQKEIRVNSYYATFEKILNHVIEKDKLSKKIRLFYYNKAINWNKVQVLEPIFKVNGLFKWEFILKHLEHKIRTFLSIYLKQPFLKMFK